MFKSSTAVVLALTLLNTSTYASDLFELNKSQNIKKNMIQSSKSGSMISFRVNGKNHGGTISVSGPAGFNITEKFESSSNTLNLLDKYSKLPAGIYHYQISAHVGPLRLIKDTINNGRGENNTTYAGTPVNHSGSFTVKGGSIQQFQQLKESSSEW